MSQKVCSTSPKIFAEYMEYFASAVQYRPLNDDDTKRMFRMYYEGLKYYEIETLEKARGKILRSWEYIGKLPTIARIRETCVDYLLYVKEKKNAEKRRLENEALDKQPKASPEDIKKLQMVIQKFGKAEK